MNTTAQNKQMSKHIMISYQWNSGELVEKIFNHLTKTQSIPVWIDKHGGMHEYLSGRLVKVNRSFERSIMFILNLVWLKVLKIVVY
jgi:hypothetical protein